MIKMIVSDMDGTLLLADASISQENLKAIRYAQDRGVIFTIATGRDYGGLKGVLDRFDLHCDSILGNGAQFADASGKIISSCYFPKKLFKDVLKIFDDLNTYYMIFTTKGFYTTAKPEIVRDAFINRCITRFKRQREDYENGDQQDMPCMHLIEIKNVDEFLKTDLEIIKVEAFNTNTAIIEQAKGKLALIDGIAYLSSFDDNVEVTDVKAQKGLILQQVVKQMEIEADEVMVLGDGLNDISMFEKFKYSFAPENADPKIKELAYQVVASCEDNGVAEAIYSMIK